MAGSTMTDAEFDITGRQPQNVLGASTDHRNLDDGGRLRVAHIMLSCNLVSAHDSGLNPFGPDQMTENTFRMFCVWMQDDTDIFKISKLLQELPKVFFLWVEGQVSMEDNQVTREVNYKSETLCSSTRWVSQTSSEVVPWNYPPQG